MELQACDLDKVEEVQSESDAVVEGRSSGDGAADAAAVVQMKVAEGHTAEAPNLAEVDRDSKDTPVVVGLDMMDRRE